MRPNPASFIPGSTACAHCMAQRRFSAITASNSSSVCPSIGAGLMTPTLFTSRVIGPSAQRLFQSASSLLRVGQVRADTVSDQIDDDRLVAVCPAALGYGAADPVGAAGDENAFLRHG